MLLALLDALRQILRTWFDRRMDAFEPPNPADLMSAQGCSRPIRSTRTAAISEKRTVAKKTLPAASGRKQTLSLQHVASNR